MDNTENNKELTTGVIDLDQIRIDKEEDADSVVRVKTQAEEEQDFEEAIQALVDVFGTNETSLFGDGEELMSFLSLEEEPFRDLSEIMLGKIEDILNTPEMKMLLKQTMRDSGFEPEELVKIQFAALKELDDKLDLPQIKKDFFKRLLGLLTNVYFDVKPGGRKIVNIPIELSDADAIIPRYARMGDGAVDLYATEDYEIAPGETKMISTGIKVAIPDGYALLIQARSGMSAKTKLRVANTPGLIDSGYRGEIKVIMENIEPKIKNITYEFNDNPQKNTNEVSPIIKSIEEGQSYFIERGQRFAQMRLVPAPMANFIQVDSVQEIGEDRQSGFGGTGDR